jgi:N-acetylglucosamine-6-phosphate deacetylase
MTLTTFTARRFDTGQAVCLTIAGERIVSIEPAPSSSNAALPWISPGFVDLQVNGYGGQEFNDAKLTVEQVERICLSQDACGVTRFLPTLTTDGHAVLAHGMRTIASACEQSADVRARVAGIHLEGPFLSKEDGPRGAHPLAHCRPPDWGEFSRLQEAAGGRIRLLTISPEYDVAAAFIAEAVASGVLVAIGHTAATSNQIRAAADAGARMSTHLGNGAHGQIRRHPNYIWDQLADDRLTASLIVDGHHLPPAVVKSFVRAKTPERCVLVSDITGMAGQPPGRYRTTGLGEVEMLEDGRLVVAGQRQYLAGAAQPIGVGVANVMQFAGVDLAAAIEMASGRPAALIGEPPGRLVAGDLANLILFELSGNGPLRVAATFQRGQQVFGAPQGG